MGAKTGLYATNPKINADGMRTLNERPGQLDEIGLSDTQRYKLCGNGVVVNVVEEIIKNLIL
jgi:site-specific DNA-cytosine methylase